MMPDLAAIFRKHLSEPKPQAGPDPPTAPTASPAPATPPGPVKPVQTEPRPTRPGAFPGDPPAPVVDPEATRTLIILELAGAEPGLRSDGQLGLAHPERVSPEERATALRHQADIAALLAYRALIERHRPVGGRTD